VRPAYLDPSPLELAGREVVRRAEWVRTLLTAVDAGAPEQVGIDALASLEDALRRARATLRQRTAAANDSAAGGRGGSPAEAARVPLARCKPHRGPDQSSVGTVRAPAPLESLQRAPDAEGCEVPGCCEPAELAQLARDGSERSVCARHRGAA
jgi:hypothetical protein